MELKQQVVSLELAKKLKELGFKQDSLFWWVKVYKKETGKETSEEHLLTYQTYTGKILETGGYVSCNYIKEHCSAYTVAELGEMFSIIKNKDTYVSSYYCTDGDYICSLLFYGKGNNYEKTTMVFSDFNEADARAKMLIYLKENDLI